MPERHGFILPVQLYIGCLFSEEADPFRSEFLYLFPQTLQLFFMTAEFFRTVFAGEILIGIF